MPRSERSSEHRVADMLEAIARIARYVEGMSERGFAADERTVDAVVRNLEVLGEAANGFARIRAGAGAGPALVGDARPEEQGRP